MAMKKMIRALTSIPSLLAAGTAGVLAVALHSWEIGALGVVATGALAAVEAGKRPRVLPPSAIALPAPNADAHTAAAVNAILRARAELDEVLLTADAGVAPLLAPIADLDAHAAKLARRSEEIAAQLAKVDVTAVRRDISELGARVAKAADETTREHYAAAHASRVAHLETIGELARAKERIGATLLSIAATLDALPARVVRLRGLEGAAADADATRAVGRDLAAMNDEIASFEETLLSINGAS